MKRSTLLTLLLLLALMSALPWAAQASIVESWTPVYTVNPTCTEQGYTVYENFLMPGTLEERDFVDPLGHDWSDWTTEYESTCYTEGLEKRYCFRCQTEEESIIPANEHEWGEWSVYTEPDCVNQGLEHRFCMECGQPDERMTDPLGHDWGEWEPTPVAMPPTCTESGVEIRTCARCGETEMSENPAKGHQPAPMQDKAPTCTEPGTTGGTVCAVCGEVLEEPKEQTPALGHDWGDWIIDSEPSCKDNGKRHHVCSRCGKEDYSPAPALGHDWGEWGPTPVAMPPTCTKSGVEVRTCARCGETEMRESPARGHQPTPMQDKGPTCTESGTTGGTVCAVCGEVLEEPKEQGAALGHRWGVWIVDRSPTCVDNGKRHCECSRCGKIDYDPVPALGHDWDEGTVTKEPGYLNPGIMTFTCTRCGETKTEEIPVKKGGKSLFVELMPSVPEFDAADYLETFAVPLDAQNTAGEPDDSPLHIVRQPEGGTVEHGGVMSLTVEAAGGVPFGYFYGSPTYTYQWYRSPSESEKMVLSGFYNLLLWLLGIDADISPDDFGDTEVSTWQTLYDANPGSYYCTVTDAEGETVTSEKAEVREQLYILRQPENVNARINKNWSVSVSAAGGTEPYQYKWYYCRNFGAEGSSSYFWAESVTGHVLNREDTDYVSNEFSVYCVISDANGESIQSDTAEIYYTEPIKVSVKDAMIRTPGGSVTLSAEIKGGREPFVCQWYGPEGEIPEAAESTIDVSKSGQYYVTVTDTYGDSATSAPATVTLKPLTIARHPEGGELPRGGGQHKLEVIVEDGNAPFWYVLYDADSGFMCDFSPDLDTGESSRIYAFTVEYPGKYYITVRDQDGREGVTKTATVTAYEMLELVDYTPEASVSSAEDNTRLTVTVRNGTKPYTYQWQRWVSDYPASSYMYWNSGRYEDMPNTNRDTIRAAWGKYQCIVTDAAGDEVYTPPIPVNYTGKEPIIIQQPENVELEYNAYWYPSATLRVDAISASGGDIAYSWRKKTASGWSVVGSGKTLYLSESAVTTEYDAITGTYRCLVTDKTTGGYVYSQEASITMPVMTINAYQEGKTSTIVVEVDGGVAPYTMEILRDRLVTTTYGALDEHWYYTTDMMPQISSSMTVDTWPHAVKYTMSLDRYAKDKVHVWGLDYKTYKHAWTYKFYVKDSTGQEVSAKVTCDY